MSESGISEGFKTTELCGIPEEWKVVRLGEVAKVKYGKANPKDTGNIPVVGSGGIYSSTTSPIVDYPTIIIGRKGTAGKVWLFLRPCYPSDTTFYLEWKKDIDVPFLFNYLVLNPLSGEHAKTTLPSLQKPDLENYLIPIPPPLEQHRIAAVLSAVQDAKKKTGAVIAAAKSLKKSLMRHLFTYGPVPAGAAESVPLVETEIGLVPEGWEVVRLGDYTKVRYGLGQPPKLADDGVPMIRATNIKRGKITPEGLIRIKRDAIPLSRDPFLKEGDIIVVRSGAYTGDLAMITKSWDGSIAGYDLIVSPLATFDPSYLSEYLLYDVPQSYFASQKARSAQPHLNARELSNTIVPLPSYLVQQKIASILSTVDKKIETEENKKKALNELFKSLLHNLMTGKIRVNHLEVGK